MAPKLRNQWFPISGMVAPKVRTGGVKRPRIITPDCPHSEAIRQKCDPRNICQSRRLSVPR